jgi:hypothetical protein
MRTWTATTCLPAAPERVLALLVDPEGLAQWSPVDFEVMELDGGRLEAGGRARGAAVVAGQRLEFDLDVLQADARGLVLEARGALAVDVRYLLRAVDDGCHVTAAVAIDGKGLMRRLLAHAAEALLAAGALDDALARIGEAVSPPALASAA